MTFERGLLWNKKRLQAMEHQRIELFGGPRICCGARVLERFPRHKAAVLLAYLALYPGQRHAREALIELFWPESDIDRAKQNLSQMLYLIRQTVGADCLQIDRATVTLSSKIQTDVRLFDAALTRARFAVDLASKRDALTDALRISCADLLPGFYEDWAVFERDRLATLREGAQASLATVPPEPLSPEPRLIILPTYLTRRIGREKEVAAITLCLIHGARLVTLAGMGGIGKTRLAAAVGEHLVRTTEFFSDGVVFVDMASLPDHAQPESLWRAVAEALRLIRTDETQRSAQHAVLRFLETRQLLLILDNAEHMCATASAVASAILTAACDLACLVTSRESLGIDGETVFPVPPLAEDAVLLFADRAQAVRPEFIADKRTAVLCRKLDGLPLAIEFVAARVRHLSVAEISDYLDSDLRSVLAQGGRGRNARHEILRTTMAWSYGLLTLGEQHLFGRLSIFSGGWSLHAAQTVCAADTEMMYGLVDKSLVIAQPMPGGGTRFRFMETVRAFADEALERSMPTPEILREKHTAYFLAQIESGCCPIQERENVRTALVHADIASSLCFLAHTGIVDELLQDTRWLVKWGHARLRPVLESRQDTLLARALCEFSVIDESPAARTYLERATHIFDIADDGENRVGCHLRLAQHLVFFSGRTEESLRLLAKIGPDCSREPMWQARYLLTLGITQLYARAHQEALNALQVALHVATKVSGPLLSGKEPSPPWAGQFAAVTQFWLATTLHWMGRLDEADIAYVGLADAAYATKGRALVAARRGQAATARILGDQAVEEAVSQNRHEFHNLLARARIERRMGDFRAVRKLTEEALYYAALEERPDSHRALTLTDLAWALLSECQPVEATHIYACLVAQETREGIAADGADPDDPAALPQALAAALGASDYQMALVAGRAMSVDEGITLGIVSRPC